MSIQAVAWALKLTVRPAAVKLLLISIANYADDKGVAWPSKSTLAKDCSIDKSGVCRHLHTLQEMGLIRITERNQEGVHLSSLIELNTAATGGGTGAHGSDAGATDNGGGTSAMGGGVDATRVVAPAHDGLSRPCDTNLKKEPSLNPSACAQGNSFWKKALNPQADHGVELIEGGKVQLTNGTRAEWLAKFDGDAVALDLALDELDIQPETRSGLRKQVIRQLSRIARMRHDSDRRYRQAKASGKAEPAAASHRVSPDTVRYAKPKLEPQPWEQN